MGRVGTSAPRSCARAQCEHYAIAAVRPSSHDDVVTAREKEPARVSFEPMGSGVIVARESRVHPRVRVKLDARLSTVEAEQEGAGAPYFVLANATTLDVADAGIGLESDSPIEPGRRVVVEIDIGDGLTVERAGKVVWHSKEPGGASFMGIAFDEVLSGLALSAKRS